MVNYYSLQSADPIVNIENDVSGVVTIEDPYLNKTEDIKIDSHLLEDGSGVIVTPDGYIITAFHVISDPQSENNHKILRKMNNNDIKTYLEQEAVQDYLSQYNSQLGSELVNNSNLNKNTSILAKLLVQKNLISVKSGEQVIKVDIRSFIRVASFNAQLVDVGNSASDDDVALLKINTDENLPYLNISSQTPAMGENIRMYGYPDNKLKSLFIIPSVATGQLIDTMPNSLGTIYYETNATAAPGYSGGPVLNSQNKVIGILIYGIGSKYSNNPSDLVNSLFLSSKYIIQICKKNNVPITIV